MPVAGPLDEVRRCGRGRLRPQHGDGRSRRGRGGTARGEAKRAPGRPRSQARTTAGADVHALEIGRPRGALDRRPDTERVTEPPLPWAVVDLDGTLADVRHRLRHVERRPKDWSAFFAAAPQDPLLPEGEALVRRLAQDHRVAYLSGRPERCRTDTQRWLERYALPPGPVYLRRDDDHRPSWMGKLSRLRRLAEDGGVDVLVDDDAVVVRHAEAAGFTVLRADWMPREENDTLFEIQESEGRT